MISNFTGAALEQQSAILDARAAQSTQLTSSLLGSRLDAGLMPLEATFGAGGLALGGTDPLMAPLDSTGFSAESSAFQKGLDAMLGGPPPQLGALRQNFLGF